MTYLDISQILTLPAIDRRAEELRLLHLSEERLTIEDFAGYSLTVKGMETTEKEATAPQEKGKG